MIMKRLETYRTFQRFLRTLLIICGCWYMPKKSGKLRYWAVGMLFSMIIYLMMYLHSCFVYKFNLIYFLKSLPLVFAAFGALLKVGLFLVNRGSMINYHRMLNDLFEEELAQNEKIRTVMLSSLPEICILAYTYTVFMISLIMSKYLYAYISIIRDLCHFRIPATNYTLPSRGTAYFWTVPDNFLYHFHMGLETTVGALGGLIACCIDIAFIFYIYQFTSTMRAMTYRLTNPLPIEKFSDILRTCVEKHQKLLQCRDTLEHIYRAIVLWHIITNAMVLCTLMYEFIGSKGTNLSSFLSFAVLKLLQMFMYTWYGSVPTSASEDFQNGIYFSEWSNSDLDHHLRTNVILIMMQKPMTINAFFFPVDAVMFKSFVNTSMSYFFLLRSVGGE